MRFLVVPSTAVRGVDYTVSGDQLSLADGENSKLVPVTLIRSTVPKLARTFAIRLLNSTTGGAAVGHPAECVVTILETVDAHGIFGNYHLPSYCFSFCNSHSLYLFVLRTATSSVAYNYGTLLMI